MSLVKTCMIKKILIYSCWFSIWLWTSYHFTYHTTWTCHTRHFIWFSPHVWISHWTIIDPHWSHYSISELLKSVIYIYLSWYYFLSWQLSCPLCSLKWSWSLISSWLYQYIFFLQFIMNVMSNLPKSLLCLLNCWLFLVFWCWCKTSYHI